MLVAELMLQRTKAEQLEQVYPFIQKYASPETFASATVGKLKTEIYSSGLACRASRFRKMGKIITEKFNGEILREARKLRELLGAGREIVGTG